MSRMSADRAGRALLQTLQPRLGSSTLLALHSRDWASSLFEGARHRLAVVLNGADAARRAEDLLAMLGDAELDYPGGFVADVVVTARLDGAAPVLAIEALTIEDRAGEGRAGKVRARTAPALRAGVRQAG